VRVKTVKGQAFFNVSTIPAAVKAATNVVLSFELTTLSTMSLAGWI
jgi:hypothetical protein